MRIGVIFPGDMSPTYGVLRKIDLDTITCVELKETIREKVAEIARNGEGELVIVPESYAHNGKQF